MLDARLDKLTERQKDCLRLVAQGYTSKEIGRQLGISFSTVDNHLLAAVHSLEVSSRAEAARLLSQAEAGTQGLGQQLPRQSPGLAVGALELDQEPEATQGLLAFFAWLLPPLGGRDHDLSASETIFAICRIAFLSALAFIACVMIVRQSYLALT